MERQPSHAASEGSRSYNPSGSVSRRILRASTRLAEFTSSVDLESNLRRVVLPDSPSIDPADVYRDLDLPTSSVQDRPYVLMNMVSTIDGKSALGHSAAGIGSRTDSLLMRQIRGAVDAVMHGAGTLRAELVDPRVDTIRSDQRVAHGLSRQPLAVAVSGSLDLEPRLRFLVNGPTGTVIVGSASAPGARQRLLSRYATLVLLEGQRIDLRDALQRLRAEHGVQSLLSEGGPSLNQSLLDAELIDEVFWTVAPKLAGGRGRAIIDANEPTTRVRARLDLVSVHEHQDELYLRYRLRRGADGSYVS